MSPRSEREGGKSADYWLHKIASNQIPNTEKMFNPAGIHIKQYKMLFFHHVHDHRGSETDNFAVKHLQANLLV